MNVPLTSTSFPNGAQCDRSESEVLAVKPVSMFATIARGAVETLAAQKLARNQADNARFTRSVRTNLRATVGGIKGVTIDQFNKAHWDPRPLEAFAPTSAEVEQLVADYRKAHSDKSCRFGEIQQDDEGFFAKGSRFLEGF